MSLAERYLPYSEGLEPPLSEVIDKISSNDDMYAGSPEHYFTVGFSAMRCIKVAMHAANLTDFRSILDFPSGYGRVLRMLKAYFPTARLAACDLNREAVDFCARTFNAIPLYSKRNPRDVRINDRFDLIWVGSLLTHLDECMWGGFLELFVSLLNPNGLLLVTTHGRRSAERVRVGHTDLNILQCRRLLSAYVARGFGYVDYSSQHRFPFPRLSLSRQGERRWEDSRAGPYRRANDLLEHVGHAGFTIRQCLTQLVHKVVYKKVNYGVSLASPFWVLSCLHRFTDLRLVSYIEYGWDNHQDVIALIKTKL